MVTFAGRRSELTAVRGESEAMAAKGRGLVASGARRLAGALLFLAFVTVAIDASADPARAEASFETAVRLFDAKDFAKAADYFARAYADEPRGKYLWNLALAELQAGRFVAAYQHLRLYKSVPDATKAHLDTVDDLSGRAGTHVGRLAVHAPAGYAVSIDGLPIGLAPPADGVEIEADVEHVVSAERDAYHVETRVAVPGAETKSVVLDAPHQEDAPRASPGPAASASMNEATPVVQSSNGSTKARNIVAISVAGLAVVAAAVGTAFWLMLPGDKNAFYAQSDAVGQEARTRMISNQNGACLIQPKWQSCNVLDDKYNKWVNDRNAETTSFMVAGGLGVAAVATFLLWPRPRMERSAWVTPQFGPRHAGISLGTSF
jgi:hypothetical protein